MSCSSSVMKIRLKIGLLVVQTSGYSVSQIHEYVSGSALASKVQGTIVLAAKIRREKKHTESELGCDLQKVQVWGICY